MAGTPQEIQQIILDPAKANDAMPFQRIPRRRQIQSCIRQDISDFCLDAAIFSVELKPTFQDAPCVAAEDCSITDPFSNQEIVNRKIAMRGAMAPRGQMFRRLWQLRLNQCAWQGKAPSKKGERLLNR